MSEYKDKIRKRIAQRKRLQARGLVSKPTGSKLARMASEGRLSRTVLGGNPEASKPPKKTKFWKPYAKR